MKNINRSRWRRVLIAVMIGMVASGFVEWLKFNGPLDEVLAVSLVGGIVLGCVEAALGRYRYGRPQN